MQGQNKNFPVAFHLTFVSDCQGVNAFVEGLLHRLKRPIRKQRLPRIALD